MQTYISLAAKLAKRQKWRMNLHTARNEMIWDPVGWWWCWKLDGSEKNESLGELMRVTVLPAICRVLSNHQIQASAYLTIITQPEPRR